jgi:protein-L-isoaspartate(D-aspartate) O-methyltransferase
MPSAHPVPRRHFRPRVVPDLVAARHEMVDQLATGGIRNLAVLDAMRTVPREAFVPSHLIKCAYDDCPLPIGEDQTISQPYIVAAMIAAVSPAATDRALEIGTGSGYSAAVLASIVKEVYTIERLSPLADAAAQRLTELGWRNVHVRCGDGTLGWPEQAPYDVVIVTAGGPRVPSALIAQLAVGGRLVMPVGSELSFQQLVRLRCQANGEIVEDQLEPVAFVPLIGAEGWPEPRSAPRPTPSHRSG